MCKKFIDEYALEWNGAATPAIEASEIRERVIKHHKGKHGECQIKAEFASLPLPVK